MSRSPMKADRSTAEQQISERMLQPMTPVVSGWHQDPYGQHKQRFFDGVTWTTSVTHFGPIPCRGCAPAN